MQLSTTWVTFSFGLFSLAALAAPLVEDKEVGAVRAFTRTVEAELAACKETFRIYELPMSTSAQGSCRVVLPLRETIPATVQTAARVEERETDGDTEVRRLTFHGDGRGWALSLYDRGGVPNWEAAEKRFRRFLDDKVNGGRYETIVTKVVLPK